MESEIFRFIIILDVRNKSNRIQFFLYFAHVIFLPASPLKHLHFRNDNKIVIINAFTGVTVQGGVGRAKAAHRFWIYVTYRRDITTQCRANVRTAIHGWRQSVVAHSRLLYEQATMGWLAAPRRAACKVNLRERQD